MIERIFRIYLFEPVCLVAKDCNGETVELKSFNILQHLRSYYKSPQYLFPKFLITPDNASLFSQSFPIIIFIGHSRYVTGLIYKVGSCRKKVIRIEVVLYSDSPQSFSEAFFGQHASEIK